MTSFHIEDEIEHFDIAEIGTKAPDFLLVNDKGNEWCLSQHLGRVTVLLFYPQNDTLVCTRQLCEVRANWESYLATDAEIVGIAPGTPVGHEIFSKKYDLPMPLLADPNRSVTRLYGDHWLYPVGLTRTVVIIDADGFVRRRETMMRLFRPWDEDVLTAIRSARNIRASERIVKMKNRMRRKFFR